VPRRNWRASNDKRLTTGSDLVRVPDPDGQRVCRYLDSLPRWDIAHQIEVPAPAAVRNIVRHARGTDVRPSLADSLPRASDAWLHLFALHDIGEPPDARLTILSSLRHGWAHHLAGLLKDLTLEKFVAVSKALENDCDPATLQDDAGDDPARQAVVAWEHLDQAKRDRNLGGRWDVRVAELRAGADEGMRRVRAMDLPTFVLTALRVARSA
jgi:hypothetical protein